MSRLFCIAYVVLFYCTSTCPLRTTAARTSVVDMVQSATAIAIVTGMIMSLIPFQLQLRRRR